MNPKVEKMTDEQLLEEAARLNQSAFRVIYRRHSARLYGICLAVLRSDALAQDALQEACIAIWRGAKSYSSAKGKAATWMNYLCRNRCIDMLRSRKYQSLLIDERIDQHFLLDETAPDEKTQQSQVNAKVRAATSALPQKQCRLIELAYFNGLSQSEIAQATGLPLGTVKSRMRLGMDKLRQSLQNDLKSEV